MRNTFDPHQPMADPITDTSTSRRMPAVERLNHGEPVLARNPLQPWENKVTFNPACALLESREQLARSVEALPFRRDVRASLLRHDALCFLLYRAQGQKTGGYDYTHSSIGLAVLSADLSVLARCPEPVILPLEPYENLGAEDARITCIDGLFYMFYTAYGQSSPKNRIRIAMATSTDLVHWRKHGLLRGSLNTLDNKNAMMFPGRVDGKYLMLHRPMEGPHALSIHLAEADHPLGEWKPRGVLMAPITNPAFVDTWIGGGAPPLAVGNGRYLALYHIGNRKKDGTREYDLGIAVIAPGLGEPVVKRDEPLLRPSSPAETTGDADLGVNNVVFVCGAYAYHGDIYFPYAGADSVILGGKIRREEIERYLAE